MSIESQNSELREKESEISIVDIFHLVIANWYWFVLSILICAGIAFFYLKSSSKVYSRKASVLIRDDSKGGSISESTAFADISFLGGKRNVDNEVLVFQSRHLMEKVARRLHLDMSYKVKNGLREDELYTHSPITVLFPESEERQVIEMTVTPVDSATVRLSDFSLSIAGEEIRSAEVVDARLNDTILTPVGTMVVTPTLYYTDTYYGKPVYITKSNMEKVVEGYLRRINISLASKTATIINLVLDDVSTARAEDILNMLIAVYNEDVINDKNQIAVNTSKFINDRLIIIERELGSVDANIESFKRENQLTDITSETGMYLQNTSRYKQEGLSLENQLSIVKYIKEYLVDPQKGSDLIPANTGISDNSVESQIKEYNDMLLKRDKLVAGSSNKNPIVIDLNNSLGAMKQTIIRSVDNLIVGLNIQLKNIREQEEQTTKRIEAVPTQQKYVLTVERQQKIKEELYLYLLNKREENALTQAITESNARIIDPASGSSVPVAPKSMMILLAAIVLGGTIPMGVLWLLNVTDTKVRTRKELDNVLTVPFLGDIPRHGTRKGEDTDAIVVHESGRDSVSEAFRIIRTNMEFMRVKSDNLQVVMFTSANPGAGKTFVSSNLAMSIAQTNKKVVLVDVDIRKGTLSGIFSNPSGRMGLTHYLSGHTDNLDDIIGVSEEYDKLDIVFSGPVPPNPAELLLSERFDYFISELRKRYDYIIVDNVPAGMVADASIVNRVADLTIFVVRSGVMDRRQLPELEKMYREEQLRNMSVILNGVSSERRGYGYGYGNGYGYGYGYGYGNEHHNNNEKGVIKRIINRLTVFFSRT